MASIPNLKHIVQRVYDDGDFDLETLEGCGVFVRACAGPLRRADANVVMLKKSSGRTHVVDAKGRRHGADAVLYLDGNRGISIDIIGKSRTPDAKPAWTVDTKWRYTEADGFVPDYEIAEPLPSPGTPPPTSGSELDQLKLDVAALKAWARSFGK